jgi:cytochrome P450
MPVRRFPFSRQEPMHPPAEAAVLRRTEPISEVKLWNGQNAWLLTRYDDVRDAFQEERLSADPSRPGYPHVTAASAVGRQMLPTFMVMDDPEHRRLRNLFLRDFMPGPINARRAEIRAIVERRIDALLSGDQPADLLRAFAQPIPAQVLAVIFGIETNDATQLVEHVMVILRQGSSKDEAAAANQALIAFLDGCIERKLSAPRKDLISELARQIKSGSLSRRDALGSIRQLFLAGQDSTASTMTMGALLLLLHPDQLAILKEKDDVDLWNAAVNEMVRFLSVTHLGRRRVATATIEIGGQPIRAGEGIILAENFANRDGAVFDNPDVFDVFRRNSSKHLGFGLGSHHCLGIHLARSELTIGLSTLFRRIPTLRLAVPQDSLAFQDDFTIYGLESLPVGWS